MVITSRPEPGSITRSSSQSRFFATQSGGASGNIQSTSMGTRSTSLTVASVIEPKSMGFMAHLPPSAIEPGQVHEMRSADDAALVLRQHLAAQLLEPRPMHAGPEVMLLVIAVVEPQEIVNGIVAADGIRLAAPRLRTVVLEVVLRGRGDQTQIDDEDVEEGKAPIHPEECRPKNGDHRRLDRDADALPRLPRRLEGCGDGGPIPELAQEGIAPERLVAAVLAVEVGRGRILGRPRRRILAIVAVLVMLHVVETEEGERQHHRDAAKGRVKIVQPPRDEERR